MSASKSRGGRPDARILRSRAAMRGALIELLGEMPLEAITGARVAERAGVGYATFFRHYCDVRALLVETVDSITDELARTMMPALLKADSGGAALALVEAVAERRTMFRSLLAGAGDALRVELARHVMERVAALPDLSPSWLPRRLAIRVAVMGTIETLDWWLSEEPRRETAQVAALLDRLVIARPAEASPA